MKPILILGGTGHYGQHIVNSLVQREVPVRILTRNINRARGILSEKVELLAGDITAPDSVNSALENVSAVIISISAFTPKLIRQIQLIEHDSILELLKAAHLAGINRLVYLSVYDIRPDALKQVTTQFANLAFAKLDIEKQLATSEFNWTILGAPPSMDIFFAMLRKNKMLVPGGGPPALPTIATIDVGEIAAQAALRDDLGGCRFRMPGPAALSFKQAAEIISTVVGHSIQVKKIPLLPIKIASIFAWPFTPYLRYLAGSVTLLNQFPQDLAAEAAADHQTLCETFDFSPTTLADEARRRFGDNNPDS